MKTFLVSAETFHLFTKVWDWYDAMPNTIGDRALGIAGNSFFDNFSDAFNDALKDVIKQFSDEMGLEYEDVEFQRVKVKTRAQLDNPIDPRPHVYVELLDYYPHTEYVIVLVLNE